MRQRLLHQFHNIKGSHLGMDKTLADMKSKLLYWPNMKRDTEEYTRQCQTCAQVKKPHINQHTELHSIPIGNKGQSIAMDHAGPFKTTRNGNKYILIIWDSFTQWPDAIAVPSVDALMTAKALFTHWVTFHGIHNYIITDKGGAYEGQVFQDV